MFEISLLSQKRQAFDLRLQKIMMQRNKRIIAIFGIICGLLLVEACGRKITPQPADGFVENQLSQRVSWSPNDLPVNLYLDSSVPQQDVQAISKAIAVWNQIGKNIIHEDFFVLRSGDPGSPTPAQDGYSKIYFMHSWNTSTDNEQGLTTVYWSGSRIFEADVRINASGEFNYFTDRANWSPTGVDIESLVIHELGHVLGLAHVTAADSVMQPSLAYGQERNTPGPTDYRDLASQY